MGKCKDVSDFDKGQIVMARQLGQSLSETAALVGCSRSAVVSTYKRWTKEGAPVNRRKGHGRPRLIDARGERRLARVVQSNSRDTVAQITEKVNAGSDRKVSEHTVHRSLLRMGHRRKCRVQGGDLTSKLPRSQSSRASVACAGSTSAKPGGPSLHSPSSPQTTTVTAAAVGERDETSLKAVQESMPVPPKSGYEENRVPEGVDSDLVIDMMMDMLSGSQGNKDRPQN